MRHQHDLMTIDNNKIILIIKQQRDLDDLGGSLESPFTSDSSTKWWKDWGQ